MIIFLSETTMPIAQQQPFSQFKNFIYFVLTIFYNTTFTITRVPAKYIKIFV